MSLDFSKYTQRIGAEFEKLGPVLGKLMQGSPKEKKEPALDHPASFQNKAKALFDTSTSLSKVLVGTPGIIGDYHFPSELIGGTCPRIAGEEESIVWNAAAEACDTERVHVVWQSVENKIWYIAVRSSELGTHPNTWCPFGALLPGMKDAIPPPVCYTYYGDESATMIMLTAEGLQIYRGTNLVVRAKAERASRELGDAPIIELVPDRIMQLTPTPWYSLSLFEDRARRILAATAVFSALVLAGFSFLVWLLASMSLISSRHDLTTTLANTQDKTMELMRTVERLRSSPMREELGKFADLNDGLLSLNGLLEVYEIRDGKTRWRAVVPPSVTADSINQFGGKNIETTNDGVVIGNAAEIEFEAISMGKK